MKHALISAYSPIDLDFATQPQPYFLYQKIYFSNQKATFQFPVAPQYSYVVRSIITKWNSLFAGRPTTLEPGLSLEIRQASKSYLRQNAPISAELTSSHSDDTTDSTTGNPPILYCYSPKSEKLLNITIFPNDVLIVDITGQKAVTLSNWKPAFIEIMVKGYYIPESHLSAYWGSGV